MAEPRPHGDLPVRLLRWYDNHARVLPWRMKQGVKPDPYKVWLSEIMLQQTTVAAVKKYYVLFISQWPTVKALANADREAVMRAWAGLGYYARARNLHACAKQVAATHHGVFPDTNEELQKLPGIGPYTAGAIGAIAFDLQVAAVDGNVERVISRLRAIKEPLPKTKPLIKRLTQSLVPEKRAGDFAQALMDLGAMICTPKSPNCKICPWADDCKARTLGIAETLPRKLPKKKIPTRKGYVFWIARQDGAVLLRQRPDKGLLGGMLEVPTTEWTDRLPKSYESPVVANWRKLAGNIEHTFTHFHLELTVLVAKDYRDTTINLDADFRWVSASELHEQALPTIMQKVVAKALA